MRGWQRASRLLRQVVTVVVASLMSLSLSVAPAPADDGITLDSEGWELVNSSVLPGGTLVRQWTNGTDTIGVSAPGGSTVEAVAGTDNDGSTSGGSLAVNIDVPVDKHLPQGQVRDSLVSQVIALGMAPEAAVRIFGPADFVQQGVPSAPDGAPSIDTDTDSHKKAPRSSACVTLRGNNNKIEAYGCDTQYLDYANKGDWYLADEFLISGTSNDSAYWTPERLTALGQYTRYPEKNEVIKWSPSSTQPTDPCKKQTSQIQSPQSVYTYSVTSDICPNKWGPWTIQDREFGSARWGKQPKVGYWESTNGTMFTHNPPDASPTFRTYAEMHWT